MENNNKAHMEYLLNELSKLTNPINNRNEFKGKFTIKEFEEHGRSGFGVDDTIGAVKLHLDLVYTQLHLDGSEYIPNLSQALIRKQYTILETEDINSFYNQFYEEVITSCILGTYKDKSFIGEIIKHGLENE